MTRNYQHHTSVTVDMIGPGWLARCDDCEWSDHGTFKVTAAHAREHEDQEMMAVST